MARVEPSFLNMDKFSAARGTRALTAEIYHDKQATLGSLSREAMFL